SALGFYPVTPASVEYAAGAPLFKHAEIDFDNGKKLFINAPNNSADNVFVQSVTYNGKAYTKNYFNHFDFQNGGTINEQMGSKANKQRGTAAHDSPDALSRLYPYCFYTVAAKDEYPISEG